MRFRLWRLKNGAVISTLFFIRLYSSLPHFYLFYFLYLERKLPKAYIYGLGVIACICYRICNRALLCIYEYGYKAYNRVKLFAYTLLGIGIRNTFSMIFYHERPTLQTAVGFVIIFVGIVLNETKPKFALTKN